MATIADLLTAEDFFRLSPLDQPAELVRGNPVTLHMPGFRHGAVCGNIVYELRRFLEGRPLGRVISNDAGVVTERGPDTVRGPDVAYYSFERLPAGSTPVGYPSVAPEIVFEVLPLRPLGGDPRQGRRVPERRHAGRLHRRSRSR